MTDTIIVVTEENGGCSVVHIAPEMYDARSLTRKLLRSRGIELKSEEDVLNFVIKQNELQEGTYRVTTLDKLPSSRYFRDAWTDESDSDTVDVNLDKAIEIKKNILRARRKPLLEALDIEYMKALETSQPLDEIVQQKQELRDVTGIEFPTDLVELEAFVPDILKGDE